MTTNTERLQSLLKAISNELYPDAADQNFSHFERYDKEQEIFALAFEREPEAFDGLRFLNNEDGLPVWIRPGYEDHWKSNHELDDEDFD